MAYIGRGPVTGSFEKQDLTADGSTTTFTLNYTVGSSSAILVSVSGVLQEPETAYNIASGGTTIVFSAAPETGEDIFVIFLRKMTKANFAPSVSLSYSVNANLTGDGSTTAFTIGTASRSQNDLLVTVNGVVFHPGDDYTLSGTTLTFSTPPSASAEIRVRYLPITT